MANYPCIISVTSSYLEHCMYILQGHISMSSWGVSWLEDERLVPEVIRLAEECAVYSIRG